MESIKALWRELIEEEQIIFVVLSNVKKGTEKTYQKVDIKPVLLKEQLMYHISYYYETKVTHENVDPKGILEVLESLMGMYFKQMMLYSVEADYQILFNKKGKGTMLKKPPSRLKSNLTHNREKQYILKEGDVHDFLVELGVTDETGKVYKKKYDKFRQLNKYLEFVEDAVKVMDGNRVIRILDFGCGKAYLTFALYYYLVVQRQFKVEIIGLDLKADVIAFCNEVATRLNYTGLKFELGDIKDYQYEGNVDMVVSLHACDTATDEAIGKACSWDAKIIFAVPCCQHELFNQIEHPDLEPMLRFGVVKDKFATLVTDTLRMMALEAVGYDVQMLEFIDMEHTPKNILIRAYKREKTEEQLAESKEKYRAYKNLFSVNPRIDAVLKSRLD